jgi:hypothetical protein
MKIRNEIIKRLLKEATGFEISLYITLAQYQDEDGIVLGIQERKITEALGLGQNTFYKLRDGLAKKGFIEVDYMNMDRAMWKMTLIGNDHITSDYININIPYLHSSEFHSCKKNVKIICLHFLQLNRDNRTKIEITFKKIMEWTGCEQEKSLLSYFEQLGELFGKWFVTDEKKKKVSLFANTVFERRKDTEAEILYRHLINYLLIKNLVKDEIISNINSVISIIKNKVGTLLSPPPQKQDRRTLRLIEVIGVIDKTLDDKGYLNPAYIKLEINKYIDSIVKLFRFKSTYQV